MNSVESGISLSNGQLDLDYIALFDSFSILESRSILGAVAMVLHCRLHVL